MYTHYDYLDEEHVRRSAKTFVDLSGTRSLDGQYSVILAKVMSLFYMSWPLSLNVINIQGVLVSEETEFRKSYYRLARSLSDFGTITTSVWRYSGKRAHPKWMDVDEGLRAPNLATLLSIPRADDYSLYCSVTADTSIVAKSLHPQRRADGTYYYKLTFDVVMLFGMTELKAQLAWIEDVSYMNYDFIRAVNESCFLFKGVEKRYHCASSE